MEDIIKYIDNQIDKLKKGDTTVIAKRKEYTALKVFLQKMYKLNVNINEIKDVVKLPENKTNFSEYRIIDDCDTENRDLWIPLDETKDSNLKSGDLLLIMNSNL